MLEEKLEKVTSSRYSSNSRTKITTPQIFCKPSNLNLPTRNYCYILFETEPRNQLMNLGGE
uniref:Uncharacterized protein n=1 Tax=Physcomitrium patens TaxID=3218 RepID=A0A7I3ZFV6_PHYPA